MALISVILPPRGADTTVEPQHCEPWAATMDAEVLWMAALGQKWLFVGSLLGRKALWGGWTGLGFGGVSQAYC